MLRSPFSQQECDLIRQEPLRFTNILEGFSESLSRYWRYLQQGLDPSLEIQVIDQINNRMKTLSPKDVQRLCDYFLYLYEEFPQDCYRIVETMFPDIVDLIRKPDILFKKAVTSYFKTLHDTDLETHPLKILWEKTITQMDKYYSGARVVNPLNYHWFFYDESPFNILTINVLIDIFSAMLEIEEEVDPYQSGGNFLKWTFLGSDLEYSQNWYYLQWKIIWVETTSPTFRQILHNEWQHSLWENLLPVVNLYSPFETLAYDTPIKEIIKGMETRRKEKLKELKRANKEDSLLYQANLQSTEDRIASLPSKEHQALLLDPSSKMYHLYLYMAGTMDLSTNGQKSNIIRSLIHTYTSLLVTNFSRLLQDKHVKNIHLLFEILGPRIAASDLHDHVPRRGSIRGGYSLSNTDASSEFDNPYVNLFKRRVYMDETVHGLSFIKVPLSDAPTVLVKRIQSWLLAIKTPILTGGDSMVALEPGLIPHFLTWRQARLEEFEAEQKIKVLWPLISDDTFLTKLDHWAQIGEQLVGEIGAIKEAFHAIVGTGKLDPPLIKGLLKNKWKKTGKGRFSRKEILNLWVDYYNVNILEKPQSKRYLTDKLRPRLSAVITHFKTNPDPELNVESELSESGFGAPQTYLYLKVRNEISNEDSLDISDTEVTKWEKKR